MDLVSQNLLLTSGGKKDSTYIDDVFSTYLYRGNSNLYKLNYIANGIKLGTTNFGASVSFETNQVMYPDSANWDFGNGDFTVECWIRSKQGTNGYYTALGQWGSNFGWMIRYASQDIGTGWSFFFSTNGSNYFTAMGSDISDGNWHHVAVSRSGGYLRTYTDGVRNTNRSTTETFHSSSETFKIGGQSSSSNYFTGLLSNVRVIKGTALYTGASFTPPTKALTNVTNTVFLGCQSPTDPTAATVGGSSPTLIGDPKALAVGPFTGSAADVKGGMVITKARTTGNNWGFYSTTQGHTKVLSSTSANGFDTNAATNEMISFDANGFTLGQDQNNAPNTNAQDISSWTFAKQKGFFDIVEYTGTGVTRTVAHNLGSVPGSIFIKRTDSGHNWGVYHRGLNKGVTPEKYRQRLNVAGQEDGNNDNGASYWANTAPTSTHFTVSGPVANNNNTNVSGATYIAYIFAGGASTADTARSVSLSGSSTRLVVGPSSDFSMGTGDFTIECWVKQNNQSDSGVWQISTSTTGFTASGFNSTLSLYDSGGTNGWVISGTGGNSLNSKIRSCEGSWTHLAYVRSSGVGSLYVNGLMSVSGTLTTNFDGTYMGLGGYYSNSYPLTGNISNLRVVKGQALYTSSFTPTYEPLTTTSQGAIASNVKLLCFNNASVTGATVTPGTITAVNNPTASTDSPFDDPEGYKFGEEGDQNIIKCGNFVTDSSNGATLDLPWEPQWFFFKQNNANNNWILLDSMRGWTADGVVDMLYPNLVNAESSGSGYEKLLGNTIRFQGYGNNYDFMYIAIRRPDGAVGKPPEAGTDVFATDTGAGSGIEPNWDANFPVDFSIIATPGTAGQHRNTGARLTGPQYMRTNGNNAESGHAGFTFDFNDGWSNSGDGSNWQSWMWKRHAGFDVVNYTGNLVAGRQIPHSLNKIPEMLWVKRRNDTSDWIVWHKGLNGGTNSGQYYVMLNSTNTESSASYYWNNTTQNSKTFFTLGGNAWVNGENDTFIAMLFASVAGISKVGYYDGTGSAGHVITTGFTPRLLIIKKVNGANSWFMYDSLRGLGAGADPYLQLENTNAQASGGDDVFATSSTGFTINQSYSSVNASGGKYIYYAHA